MIINVLRCFLILSHLGQKLNLSKHFMLWVWCWWIKNLMQQKWHWHWSAKAGNVACWTMCWCPVCPPRGAGSNSRWWGWIIMGQQDPGQAGPAPVTCHNAVQCSDHSLFIRLNHPTRHGVIRGIYIILWLIEYHNQNTHCCCIQCGH